LPAYLGAVPWGCLEHRHRIGQVRTRRDADAAYLRGQRVGDVVAVQVSTWRSRRIRGRPQQDLLQESVGDHVLDHHLAVRRWHLHPRAAIEQRGAELALRQRVAHLANAPSVNFMMLPLCTKVTDLRC